MIVSEGIRKCVSFLLLERVGKDNITRRTPVGTAFFVVYGITDTSWARYVVTAGHVVQAAHNSGGKLYLRLNRRDGGTYDLPLPDAEDWTFNLRSDVAVWHPNVATPECDITQIGPGLWGTPEWVAENRISEGDETFFCGLFVAHPGGERNLPVVRFGNIALMPHEKVSVEVERKTYRDIDAYLIEARSWGGSSGSPAFVHLSPMRYPGTILMPDLGDITGMTSAEIDERHQELKPVRLLGLVQGHMRVDERADSGEETFDTARVRANAGIAVVVPMQAIIETLEDEKLMDERERIRRRHESEPPVADR